MKKIYQLILATFLLIITIQSTGQVAYSPVVESLTQEITEESLMELENPLTGTVPTIIGGEEYTIATRNAFTEGNEKAAQWIYERFEEFGLEPWYHEYDANGTNVLAKIEGSEFPDQQYIICGHYDNMPSGSLAPGADDNASGTVAVLEAAR
ncbi:MAG TPA: M28 family peptidase, partial [Bacteroidales bacterium]|nr:M28 family peptidase [Bacteroidales bacterium]